MLHSSKKIGEIGEDIASNYLKSLGFLIICRNFRSKFGEIDIIAKDDNTLVFVEVKTRRNERFGAAVEQITKDKQKRIMRVAKEYFRQYKGSVNYTRFDVVAINLLPDGNRNIHYIKRAFDRWR